MRVQRRLYTVSGSSVFRLPSDAGFEAGKIYRMALEEIPNGAKILIKGPSLARKKYKHATIVYGCLTLDRTTVRGTKNGPTIRLFAGDYEPDVTVDYRPGEKSVVLWVVKNKNP